MGLNVKHVRKRALGAGAGARCGGGRSVRGRALGAGAGARCGGGRAPSDFAAAALSDFVRPLGGLPVRCANQGS
jgi:hypothetical protein